jgi:hypothetical protein
MRVKLETQVNSILLTYSKPGKDDDPETFVGKPLYSRETIDKTLKSIPKFQTYIQEKFGIRLSEDYNLYPAPYGSVDVVWELINGKIAFNVPEIGNNALYQGRKKVKRGMGILHGELKLDS